MSIEGVLRNFKKKSMKGLLTDENGNELTDREVREYLNEGLKKGWKKIPCGDCETFDYVTGCPGHPINDDNEVKEYLKEDKQ
jgi:hypothetical protein